jgi:ATP-dependent helicase/nuclease subunit A
VILANLVQNRRFSSRVLVDGGRRLAFRLGLLETADFAERAENEKMREAAETIRLLYVAATRAGDTLVIPRIPKAGSYYHLIEGHLEDGKAEALTLSELPALRGESRPFVRFGEPGETERRSASAIRAAWIEDRASLLRRARRAPGHVAPSQFAGEAFARGEAAPYAGASSREARDRALAFGLAFHRIMELADFSSTGGLAALAASTASALGIEEDASELERLASAAMGSELIARAARARRRLRETPFTIPWEGGFIEGRIDLLFEDASGWTLVDYKTDDVAAPDTDESLALYRPQAAVYALALKSLGIECKEGIALYFARPGVARMIELSAGLEEEAERLVRRELATPEGA